MSQSATSISIAIIYRAGMLSLADQNIYAAIGGEFANFMMHLSGELSEVEHIPQYRHTSAWEFRKRLQRCLD